MVRPAAGEETGGAFAERSAVREHLAKHWAHWLLSIAVGVHLLMMGSLFFHYIDPLFHDSSLQPQAVDSFAIYEAGHNVLHGRSAYTTDLQDTSTTPYHSPYRYLPFFAYAAGAPMNALPPWNAYWAWVALYELLLVVNAYATWRVAGRGVLGLLAAALWFPFTPFYLEQYMGQFSFLMATLLFYTGTAIARGRHAMGAALWAMSLLVKSNSAALAPAFVRLRRWRTLVAGGAAVVITNAPFFLWRPHDLRTFYDANIATSLGRSSYLFRNNLGFFQYYAGDQGAVALVRNVYHLMHRSSDNTPFYYTGTLIGVVLAVSLAATFFGDRNWLELFAVWVSVYFLTYGVWEHHYVMYLPVLVLLFVFEPRYRVPALVAYVFVAAPTPYWLFEHVFNTGPLPPRGVLISQQEVWPAWAVVLQHTIKCVPVMLLWGYVCASRLMRREVRGTPTLVTLAEA